MKGQRFKSLQGNKVRHAIFVYMKLVGTSINLHSKLSLALVMKMNIFFKGMKFNLSSYIVF
uniref:Uncharacterized protein n=1 Tax=Solanum lycopersicum TaxID=4081 RepID=A0A494G8P1_SOLLC